jgi:hypothetical protein
MIADYSQVVDINVIFLALPLSSSLSTIKSSPFIPSSSSTTPSLIAIFSGIS